MERQLWTKQLKRRRDAARLRLALFCLCLVALVGPAGSVTLTTALDRDTVVLGETVTLSFKFDGIRTGGMPQLPAIPGLQIAGGISSGFSSITGSDGQMQNVQTFSVPLQATRVGDILIPGFNIEVGGQKLTSAPLTLKVIREDPTAPPASYANQSAFLWLVLPRQEFYLGESFSAELRLYLRPGVRNIDGYQPPQLQGEGFTASAWRQAQNYQRRVGDRVFTIVPIVCTVAAAKTGPLKFAPLNAAIVLNPPDPFEGFFGRRSDSERLALTLPEQEFRILPLPTENKPADFTGAVGNYTMSVTVGPTNVATGDPITVRVEISGRGALDAITLPEQAAWHDFKTYPPTAKVESTDPTSLQGRKIFEQVITPESTDIKELPSFSFSYFDPAAAQYRSLQHPATPLIVRPGGATVAPVIAASSKTSSVEGSPQQQDIVPIKPRLGTVTKLTSARRVNRKYLALNLTPALALLGVVAWRKRKDALASNPRLRRQRQVEAAIRTGLERLRALASENKSDEFFAELVRLLQEKLGERLDRPASAITEAVIDEKLRPRGLPDSTLAELHELFQLTNLARYAPVKSSQELAAIIPKLESALRKLDEVKA